MGGYWLVFEEASDEDYVRLLISVIVLSQIVSISLSGLLFYRYHNKYALKAVSYGQSLLYMLCILLPSVLAVNYGIFFLLAKYEVIS